MRASSLFALSKSAVFSISKKGASLITAFTLVFGSFAFVLPSTASAIAIPTAVYDSTTSSLPPNVASLGYQATQTAEFGDFVHLTGTDRILQTVIVTMSNWALEATPANVAFCVANPEKCPTGGFIHPITLNVYATPVGDTPGILLATKTVDITVPWRPVADPTCPGGTAWRADDSACYNGYAFNAEFDMSNLAVTLPNDVIIGIAYNTQTYGASPLGVDGPYNSLNVGVPVSQPVTDGVDDNTNEVFWNTMTASNYNDNGAGGTGTFRRDSNWSPYGTVAMRIEATAPEPGAIQITKYECPEGTTVVRSVNGVGGTVPDGCTLYSGATFGYVHGSQTDAHAPYPELSAPITEGGATDVNGLLTLSELTADGRYLVVETDGTGSQLPAEDVLGLYCMGDGDTSDNNDNQELTFVSPGETVQCVAYNEAPPDTTAPNLPMHLSPEDGAVRTSADQTLIDWTDVTDLSGPIAYYYQSSNSSATTTGGAFTSPAYNSGALAVSEIPTSGTPEGMWYWHVRAVDGLGNSTDWTDPWLVTVDNTPPDVTVTIVKYINDEKATAEVTGSASFPMHAVFPGGEGDYALDADGFNGNPEPYQAITGNMAYGSDYSTWEITSTEGPILSVGTTCVAGAYRLVGYKTGNTLAAAENATLTTDVPAFTYLTSNKYVIVVNEDCDNLLPSAILQPTESEETSGTTELEARYLDENGDGNDGVQWAVRAGTCAANTGTVFGNVDGKNTPFSWTGGNFFATIDTTTVSNGSYCFVFNPTEDSGNTNQRLTRLFSINNIVETPEVTIHIYKYLGDAESSAQILDEDDVDFDYKFPMQSSWSAENIGAGSGTYVLGNDHGHPSEGMNYTASTSVMSAPADYSTSEVTSGDSLVHAIGEECTANTWRLVGYKVGETLSEAQEATISSTAPSFTSISSDRHIIVINEDCDDVITESQFATVTACKVDTESNKLGGWTLSLTADASQSILVPTNSVAGANTSPLVAGLTYVATAVGTYANGGLNDADAEFTSLSTPRWDTNQQGYPGFDDNIFDLQVDGQFVNWGDYNSSHIYTYAFTQGSAAPVNFRVFDGTAGVPNEGWYGDNSGNLSVTVARTFSGVTNEETGCVTFENVPFGSYTMEEVAQEGWTNVSGLGDVTVDQQEETFTVVNRDTEEQDGGGDEEEQEESTPTITTFGGGGGNGPVSGSFGGSSGQVLGASTSTPNPGCDDVLLTDFMRRGKANNPSQVMLLQNFLNTEMDASLPVSGVFGLLTENVVKSFQTKYSDDVLAPWGITYPTGYVYKTTLWKINQIHCADLNTPQPIVP